METMHVTADYLSLLKYVLVVTYMVHLPFISLVIGGSFLSLVFNISDRIKPHEKFARFAQDLIQSVTVNVWVGIILGIVPLFTLLVTYKQMLAGANIHLSGFLISTILLVAFGLVGVYVYRHIFLLRQKRFAVHIVSGAVGFVVLLLAYFFLVVSTSIVLETSLWPFIQKPWHVLFSWRVIWRFAQFLCITFALTGAGVLFFFFNWKEAKRELETDYARLVRNTGVATVMFAVLPQPIFVIWNLTNTPDVALSLSAFFAAILFLTLIMLACFFAYKMVTGIRDRAGVYVFGLVLASVFVFIITDSITMATAINEHSESLLLKADKIEQERQMEREERLASASVVDSKRGQKIFDTRCSACHRFDEKLVGPPLNTVLPKYEEKIEELVAFISNPTKINPDFPAMPNLGLSDPEVRSVVAYVLGPAEK